MELPFAYGKGRRPGTEIGPTVRSGLAKRDYTERRRCGTSPDVFFNFGIKGKLSSEMLFPIMSRSKSPKGRFAHRGEAVGQDPFHKGDRANDRGGEVQYVAEDHYPAGGEKRFLAWVIAQNMPKPPRVPKKL